VQGIVDDILAGSFTVWQSKTILGRSGDRGGPTRAFRTSNQFYCTDLPSDGQKNSASKAHKRFRKTARASHGRVSWQTR